MKNFLFISPHYPQRLYFLAERLKDNGFNVLGIGDTHYDALQPGLKTSLTEYSQVSLGCYNEDSSINEQAYSYIYQAAAYLRGKYGPFHAIESFNEWWLPLDARLRSDFNVPGVRPGQLKTLTRKSFMKRKFMDAGIAVAEGKHVEDLPDMLDFMLRAGGPIAVKPDRGVGASDTHKIVTPYDAERFFEARNRATRYYMERFVSPEDRELLSFDGLADHDGNVLFHTAHKYNDGLLEITHGGALNYYNYKIAEIPEDLYRTGMAAVKTFDIRSSFFHFEFFREKGRLLGLEINARPPGVLTLDMVNLSRGIDCWDIYAKMISGVKAEYTPTSDLVAAYCGRKSYIQYLHPHDEIMSSLGTEIPLSMPMDSAVMGDYAYVVLTDTQSRRKEILDYIQETSR